MLQNLFAISLGAVFGALARFAITHFSSELTHHHGFPYGTLIVNVVGSFLAGFILVYTTRNGHDDLIRLALVTGFCGAFTTFSAFAYESVDYLRAGSATLLLVYVLANNVLSLGAAFLGIISAQRGA
jgi:fluoride exporter